VHVNIAILGAGGFVGSHMVEHLLRRGEHEVVCVDLTDEKLKGLPHNGYTFHRADVRQAPDVVERVIERADVVVDLIAYANPSIYVTAPLAVFELNFMQNLEIARLCMCHGKRLIQYSSAEVYGKARDGSCFSEDRSDSTFGPVRKQRWIYAVGKLLLEQVLYAHGMAGDLVFTIIRPFNFVGSRLDYLVAPGTMGGPRVFAHFMSALLTGGPIHLVDGGRVHRAFLHIEDANEAFQTILDNPDRARNEIFNVGNPANNVTIRELAVLMLELYEALTGEKAPCELVEVSGEEFYGAGYEDADRLPPDITKLKSLGWEPKRDLRTTFADAMTYYLENRERELANLRAQGNVPDAVTRSSGHVYAAA